MSPEQKPDLMDYVTGNFEHLEELTKQYRDRKSELLEKDPLFKDDINEQYKDHIKYIVCLEISRDMACSYEDAMILYEELQLGDLFG